MNKAWDNCQNGAAPLPLSPHAANIRRLALPTPQRTRPMAHNNERKIERAERAAQQAREQRVKAEALTVIEAFNSRLAAGREPFFLPTIRAALITSHHWMIVHCRSCNLVLDLDLRVKRRPGEATILMALRDVKCPRCNGHGRPEIRALAQGPRR
jgi:hypothetical protein